MLLNLWFELFVHFQNFIVQFTSPEPANYFGCLFLIDGLTMLAVSAELLNIEIVILLKNG
jgi:hypothetical protein